MTTDIRTENPLHKFLASQNQHVSSARKLIHSPDQSTASNTASADRSG